ncbi:uncharacterized protein LOC128247040 [Octopus bimaculoides]|uniref:uncharacterized protein LOC128247040 n=1 Tax=Octopus bimaculoides TaxID=37653 RepID=UPI0022DEDD7D|nr:uncharacterized protein LOC128247040 [Octopus bimaculoides]
MNKIWHCCVIKYLQKKVLTPKSIHTDMITALRDGTPALSTVDKWAVELRKGRKNLEDDPRSGSPTPATTEENTDHVHHMVGMTDFTCSFQTERNSKLEGSHKRDDLQETKKKREKKAQGPKFWERRPVD